MRLCRCVLSYVCDMQVGPDTFGSDSKRAQLFWKQWNRIRHKSVLMVGSVLWKGFSESLFSNGRRGSAVSPLQAALLSGFMATIAETRPGSSPPPPPCESHNPGNLNKTNVTQISRRNHKGRNMFWEAAFINNLCISKLLADVCGRFLNAKFHSTFGEVRARLHQSDFTARII